MKKYENYRLTLIEGDFFPKSQDSTCFLQPLFAHFSLLSWLSENYKIIILDKTIYEQDQKQLIVYEFTKQGKSESSFLIQFDKDYNFNELSYCIIDKKQKIDQLLKDSNKLQQNLKVIISKHQEASKLSSVERSVIYVDILDYVNYFKGCKPTDNYQSFNHQINQLKTNEISYYYKEPLTIRNKVINKCHFNLAFQGGGAKGVSYVGVYKALKDLHRDVPIRSIIGSSAGGILALAITTEMQPEDIASLCLNMDTVPKDKLYKKQSQITPQIQAQFDVLINKIKALLHNYGILEHTIFDQLIESLSDNQTSQKILNALQHIHPSVAQLFTLTIQPEPKERTCFTFFDEPVYTRRFNYYGILMAGLMKGKAYEDLAAESLIDFLAKHYEQQDKQSDNKKYDKRIPIINKVLTKWGFKKEQIYSGEIFSSELFREKVKTLTLKEYYSINEIEFTCTSVDLDDQILRFFNHKTTPDLPVCKMIQMSGSFPIAFQAQKWDKSWGKYYIHYDNVRKEIDLTGHEFTDGGLLANFPIKYLDNQLMRPMYFSHQKSDEYSILYGFGLDQVESRETVDKVAEQQKTKAITELKEHISSKISKFRLLKNLIFSDSAKELQKVNLNEIPVINYIMKLLQTFKVADYNLNVECFERSVIQMEVQSKMIEDAKEISVELQKFNAFDSLLQGLKQLSMSKASLDPSEIIRTSLEKCKVRLNEFQNIENRIIYEIRNHILENLYGYEGLRLKNNLKSWPFLSTTINNLQSLCHEKTFKMQESISAKMKLIDEMKTIIDQFSKFKETSNQELQMMYKKILDGQRYTINKIRDRIRQITGILKEKEKSIMSSPSELKKGKAHISCSEYYQITFIDYDVIFDLISMERRLFLADMDYITTIMNEIKSLHLPVIAIEKQIFDNLPQIQQNIRRMVQNATSKKLHIVLEAKENSHLYYCGMFSILQEILNSSEHKDKSIDMITSSDIHSIFSFLYAGGRKINNIRREMWKVESLITMEKNIDEEYKQLKWAQTKGQQISQLLQLTWDVHYDLFGEIQQYLSDNGNTNLKEQLEKMKNQFVFSKKNVTNSMDNVLHYVIEVAEKVMTMKDVKQRKKAFAKLISLKNGYNGKNYRQKNEKISKNTQRFIQKIMFHFEQLVSYTLLNNHFIKDTFQSVTDARKNDIWKGALIKKLLSTKKLQIYIKDSLKTMNLNPNTTLGQFYKFCSRKITLNFILVNKGQERLQIVNQYTKPNMPLWAAIIASTSLPLILPEFMSKEQWEINSFTDSRLRKLVDYFFLGEGQRQKTVYFSGNYVSTLPLELLTNQRIATENYASTKNYEELYIKANQSKVTSTSFNNTDQIKKFTQFSYITFSFKKKQKAEEKVYEFNSTNKHFFSLSNVLNLALDGLMGNFKNISIGFKDILARTEILKLLSTRIECHDNTIMYYYYDQTIKLPIRLGTLDFHKIQEQKVQILMDCVYEAEFVVRGVFGNLQVSKDLEEYKYLSNKQVYLQYQTKDDKAFLHFISKSVWNQKLSTMFKVFYKNRQTNSFIEYLDEPICITNDAKEIQLKFIFPDMDILKLLQHQFVLDLTNLKKEEYSDREKNLIFKLNFQKIQSRVIQGSPLYIQKMRTRFIPSSKPHITFKTKEDESSSICLVKTQNKGQQKAKNYAKDNYIIMRSIINFKNNGLHCKGCASKLQRAIKKENLGETAVRERCSKCTHRSNMIGFDCQVAKCKDKEGNRYCFPCILVYLIAKKKSNYVCTLEGHSFIYGNLWNSQDLALCYFCCSASNEFYRDQVCDINICLKCSLILDSKTSNLDEQTM